MKTQQSLMYALLAVIFLTSSCHSAGFVRPDPKSKQMGLDNVRLFTDPIQERFIKEKVIETIYKRLKDPSFNPLLIPQLSFPFEQKNLFLKNASVTGLSSLVIDNLNFNHQLTFLFLHLSNAASVKFAITLPSILVKGEYSLDGKFSPINITGNGPFEVSAQGIKVAADVTLRRSDRKVFVNTLKLTLGLGGLHVNIQNLMNDPTYTKDFNNLINKGGLELFEVNKETIQLEAAKRVIAFINPWLSDISLEEIVNIITGKGH